MREKSNGAVQLSFVVNCIGWYIGPTSFYSLSDCNVPAPERSASVSGGWSLSLYLLYIILLESSFDVFYHNPWLYIVKHVSPIREQLKRRNLVTRMQQ
jgi:hypothetical protein